MKLFVILMFLFSINTLADLPKNNLWIPVSYKGESEITKEIFDSTIALVQKVYSPIVAKKGGVLNIKGNWEDGTVNAYAQRVGNTYEIRMFGGLARHEHVTSDGFMAVICHELGHHIGGFPKYKNNDWASNEGQSDYWSTLKCMKKTISFIKRSNKINKIVVPEIVTSSCKTQYKNIKTQKTCERISMAGKSLANLLAALGNRPLPNFETPSKVIVKTTLDTHPEAQARLDTYFAGALCSVNIKIDVSDVDETIGTCVKGIGSRPRSWFAPKLSTLSKY